MVADILDMMDESLEVNCAFTAYGVQYASSWNDGMRTVADCKDRLNYDCIHARVTGICQNETGDGEHRFIQINASLTK